MHWIIERHDQIGSTMDAADERAKRGAPAGVVVVAAEQTAGRGQRGRRWMAPAGTSLLMTVVARPDCRPDDLPTLPEHAGKHVIAALRRVTGLTFCMKPPNDVLYEGRKVAGILCQSSIEGDQVRYVLIGIGINVNIPCKEMPVETATSLLSETGRTWDLNSLLEAILDELEQCWFFLPCRNA